MPRWLPWAQRIEVQCRLLQPWVEIEAESQGCVAEQVLCMAPTSTPNLPNKKNPLSPLLATIEQEINRTEGERKCVYQSLHGGRVATITALLSKVRGEEMWIREWWNCNRWMREAKGTMDQWRKEIEISKWREKGQRLLERKKCDASKLSFLG